MQFLAYIVVMLASYFISQAMVKKPPPPEAAKFEDFSFPQAAEGTPQAVFFGDCWSGDWMVLGVGNFRTTAIKSGGGKK